MSNYRIIPRNDTKENWEKNNPILRKGEIGNVSDYPNLYKMGDGSASWNSLPYRGYNGNIAFETGSDENSVMSQKAVTDSLAALQSSMTDADNALSERVLELEKAQFPVELTLTINPTLEEYTDLGQNVEVKFGITRKGEAITPKTLSITNNGTVILSNPQSSGTITAKVVNEGANIIAMNATYEGMSASKQATVQLVRAMYFGFSSYTDGKFDFASILNKQSIKTVPSGTYKLTNKTSGHYLWLVVPSSMTINKVTLNGFDVPMEAAVTMSNSSWRGYRSTNNLVAGDYTFVIS